MNDWMEGGIVPGGTGSLLYKLIFPNHALAGSVKVKESSNISKSSEPMKKLDEGKSFPSTASSAKTVAQIKDESKAKQLARLEAASLWPKKKEVWRS